MNKKQVVASLNQIANELDSNGLFKEANVVTSVMVKISQSDLQYSGSPKYKPNANLRDPRNIQYSGSADYKPNANLRDPKNIQYSGSSDYKPYDKPAGTEPMPPYDLVPDSPMDTVPDSPSTNNTPIGKPKPSVPGKPSQPSSKPGMPSKPGGSMPSAPKSADGLDRWVNKAENIYSAWALKNANPNSSAFGLIADIVDYMQRVKSKLPSNLQGSADAKINKVKQMKDSIPTGTPLTAYLLTTDYSEVSGVKGKGANPFTYDPSKRLTGKQLDYQADYESKRY
jgi:hypothetical protein